ncbi:MAG: hypothetical protein K2N58_07720 [Treponemataceae bacterium]|nr:hypothetical protein [Treponemataceae bacterium]
MNDFLERPLRGKSWPGFRKAACSTFSQIAGYMLALVYGAEECLSCHKATFAMPVCAKCRETLENYVQFNSERRCSKCGKILISEIGICMECRERASLSSLDALYPIHSYRQWKKDLAFAWKIEGQRRLSPLFADLLYKALRDLGLERTPVVPVPPRADKLRKEGWDQIDELSTLLSKRHGVRILRALERKDSIQQKKLGRDERLGTSGALYDLLPRFKDGLGSPEKVVLLDDIVTTGATMEKCAWLLRKAGAKKVYGLALFSAS